MQPFSAPGSLPYAFPFPWGAHPSAVAAPLGPQQGFLPFGAGIVFAQQQQQQQAFPTAQTSTPSAKAAAESCAVKLDRKEAERAPSKKKGTKERAYSEDDMRALLKLCLTNEISLRAACLQQRMPTARQTLGRYLAAIKAKVPVRRCQ